MPARRPAALATVLAAIFVAGCGGARATSVPVTPGPVGVNTAAEAAPPGGRGPAGEERPAPSAGRSQPRALRDLVLMVDGVSWEVMDSLHRAGHFRGFTRPSLVLSTFPSLTTVAFRDIWRESPTAGYEDRYFDLAENRLRGGAVDVLLGNEAGRGFHRHIDVEGAALVSALEYAFPETIGSLELKEVRDGVLRRAPRDTALVAYICATDAIVHADGRAALVAVLLRVESLLDEVRTRYPGVRVDVLSDHGNDLVPSRQLPLDADLARAGLRIVSRLERPGDVVVPRFGLVGSVAFYAAPDDRARLVEALTRAEGVELVTWRVGAAVEVQGRAGRARIEGEGAGARLRYASETGDPLGFDPIRERLHASGELDAVGFAPDSAWLRESLATPYPDALRRLLMAYRGEVLNPATVLVSLAPGGHFGDVVGDRLTHMRGTHGSLRARSSSAFLMSTAAAPPPVLRTDQVLDYLPRAVQARVLRLGGAAGPARTDAFSASQR